MTQTDAFAFKASGLNAFLFADVGIEQNGSTLTVLSTLARLGNDPWALAAEWTKMPNAAGVDRLTECILRMPLSGPAYVGARATATRLILLLPRPGGQVANRGSLAELNIPEWLPLAAFCVFIGLAVVVSTFTAASVASTAAMPPAPIAHTSGQGK